MSKKRVYFTIENFWPGNLGDFLSSREIIRKLNLTSDLILVRPDDFLDSGKIKQGFKVDDNDVKLRVELGEHVPSGNVFVIYGDNSRKADHSLDSAMRMYQYLSELEEAGRFERFINTPSAEKKTLKTQLPYLSREFDFLTPTFNFQSLEKLKNFMIQGPVIGKSALSCMALGVKKVTNENVEIFSHDLQSFVFQNVMPLGLETRIIILGDSKKAFGRAHIGSIYDPNSTGKKIKRTVLYRPSKVEVEAVEEIRREIGADIISLDCMGLGTGQYGSRIGNMSWLENSLGRGKYEKIKNISLQGIEINGTGTGVIINDRESGRRLYDHSEEVVRLILGEK